MTALINMPRAAWKRQPLIAVKPSVIAQQLGVVFLINFSTYPMDCVANYPLTVLGGGYVPGSDANGVGLSSISGTLRGFSTKNNPVELQFQKLTIFSIFRSIGGDGGSYHLARSMGSSPALSYGVGVWRGFSQDGYFVSVNGSGSSMKDKILTENDAFFDDSKHHVIVVAIGDDKVDVTTNRKVYSTLTDYSGTIDYSRTDLPLYVNCTVDPAWNAFTGILYACGIFNRVLTQAEALFVCNNPWQLFSPNPRRFYLIPSAGSGSTIPALLHHYRQLSR